MSMKHTQLTTYWEAGDAYGVITFLDELRDALMAVYGEDIAEMLMQEDAHNRCDQPAVEKDDF